MRAPKEKGTRWENVISRFFSASGIPLTWEPVKKRFTGIRRHAIGRVNPSAKTGLDGMDSAWRLMPQYLRKIEADGDNGILIVTNLRYGDQVEDSIVVLRLGTFTPMLKAFIDADKERWL